MPLIWGVALFYLLVFFIFYPEAMLIADEKAYFEQSYALARGKIYTEWEMLDLGYIPKHYPLGTALYGAFFIFCFGSKAIFLSGFLALLIAFFALASLLRRRRYHPCWSILLFLFPPAILLSRQIMSELPSLAILSIFLLLVFSYNLKNPIYALLTGLLGGLSLAFRESNVLIIAPFLLGLVLRRKSRPTFLMIGGLLGFALRLISAKTVYGNWFYMKDPGVGFGLSHLPSNLFIYVLALCVFVPLGLPALFRYSKIWATEIHIAVWSFLLFYLCYGYNGWPDSGLYALILGPRFFIPLLPLLIIAIADWAKDRRIILWRKLLPLGGLLAILLSNAGSAWLGQSHASLISQLYQRPAAMHYLDLSGPAYKYVSNLYGSLNHRHFNAKSETPITDTIFYVHFFEKPRQTEKKEWKNSFQNQAAADTTTTVDGLRLISIEGRSVKK